MGISLDVTKAAQDDIDGLDMSIHPDVTAKLDQIAKGWPDHVTGLKPLTGPWKNHYRVQVRKDWRIIVKPERGLLVVVRVAHRSNRKLYGDRDMTRPLVHDTFTVVPRSFLRKVMKDGPTRNFASEYVMWSLGQKLRATRLRAKLSQIQLAKKIHKAQSTVSMAEKGQIRVSRTYVLAVIRACKVR